jgi:hypothetical protein
MLGASIEGQLSVVYKIKKKKNTRRKKIMSAFIISGESVNNAFNRVDNAFQGNQTPK